MYYDRGQSDKFQYLEDKPKTQHLQSINGTQHAKIDKIDSDILIERNDLKIDHKIGQGHVNS